MVSSLGAAGVRAVTGVILFNLTSLEEERYNFSLDLILDECFML